MPARRNGSHEYRKRQTAENEGLLRAETSSSSTLGSAATLVTTATTATTTTLATSTLSSSSRSSIAQSATTTPTLSTSSPPAPTPATSLTSAPPASPTFSSLLTDAPLSTALPANATTPLLLLTSASSSVLELATATGNATLPHSTALPIIPAFVPDTSTTANAIAATDNPSDDASSSPGTKHAAIAVGSIFGVIVLACIIFIVIRMRRGLRFADVFKLSRHRKDSWSSHGTPHMTSRGDGLISDNTFVKRKSRVMVLANALPDHLSFSKARPSPARPGTASSQRPLVVGAHSLGQINEEPESPSFELGRPVLHIVNGAPVSSPSTPGPMTPTPPAITRQTASPVPSPLHLAPRTPTAAQASPVGSPLPEYLQGAKFATGQEEKASRCSDTTGPAPKTPKTPHDHRLSAAVSTTSSVPRYRTVDSWCGAQANRLGDRPVQDHLQQEIEAELKVDSRLHPQNLSSYTNAPRKKSLSSSPVSPLTGDHPVPMPGLPTPVSPIREDSILSADATPAEMAYFPNPKLDQARRREKCQTLMSDITVFRAHPGTPVVFSDESERVPSMILDARMNQSMPDILRSRS